MSDILKRKHEIVTTTNTIGWRYIQELGEEAVKAAERRAIDEEDDAKGARLRHEARAARTFFTDFIQAVEVARNIDAPERPVTEDSYFYDVAY